VTRVALRYHQRLIVLLSGLLTLAAMHVVTPAPASANPFGSGCDLDDVWSCALVNTSSPIYQWEGTAVQISGLSASFNSRLSYYRDNSQLNPIRRDAEQFPEVRVTDYTYTDDQPVALGRQQRKLLVPRR
jgi:hypothetical protein